MSQFTLDCEKFHKIINKFPQLDEIQIGMLFLGKNGCQIPLSISTLKISSESDNYLALNTIAQISLFTKLSHLIIHNKNFSKKSFYQLSVGEFKELRILELTLSRLKAEDLSCYLAIIENIFQFSKLEFINLSIINPENILVKIHYNQIIKDLYKKVKLLNSKKWDNKKNTALR